MKNNSNELEESFRLLIVGNQERFVHLEQFVNELNKVGIKTKLVYDLDYIDKFFDLNFFKKNQKKNNLNKMLDEFKPTIVLLDRISKIGEKIIEKNIPIWILLRGNYWEELEWAKKTIYKNKRQQMSVKQNEKLYNFSFKKSELILPISK